MSKTFGKRSLSLLLTLAMVVALFAGLTVSASALSGEGTEANPYLISSATDLDNITDLGAYYRLENDITASASWAGLGTSVIASASTNSPYETASAVGFTGTLDGAGFTITVSRSVSTSGQGGVVNYLAPEGTVKNLVVAGTMTASGSVDAIGGVVGYNSGTINGVSSSVTVSATNAYNVGGIAGFNNGYYGTSGTMVTTANGYILNSINSGAVSSRSKTGGIAGENSGLIASCSNSGAIANTTSGKNGAGGIAGRNGNNNTAYEAGVIRNCSNTGAISSNNGRWVGGIAGFQSAGCTITNTYNVGNLSGDAYLDHTVGKNEGTITNAYGLEDATGAEKYDGTTILTDEQLKGEDVVDNDGNSILTLLNNGAVGDDALWRQTEGAYPELRYVETSDGYAGGGTGGATGGDANLESGIILGGTSEGAHQTLTSALNAVKANDTVIYVAGEIALTSGTYTTSYENVTLMRSRTFDDILFTVSSGADVTLSNLTIDGNRDNVSGRNLIRVYGGTLTLNSTVTLQRALSESTGGALHVQGGTVNSAATFLKNTARNGGSVAVSQTSTTVQGVFNMTGGSITDSDATDNGGAVYLATGATFNMTAGTISGNTAANGAGIYHNGATLTLDPGAGTFNLADVVYLATDKTIEIESGLTSTVSVLCQNPYSGRYIGFGTGDIFDSLVEYLEYADSSYSITVDPYDETTDQCAISME